jgi:hypothetical protein
LRVIKQKHRRPRDGLWQQMRSAGQGIVFDLRERRW